MPAQLKVHAQGTQGSGVARMLKHIRVVGDHGGYKLGWPASATYPSGVHVADVALWNEFGVPGRIPERPFFRQGNIAFKRGAAEQIVKNARFGVIDRRATRKLAMYHTNLVRDSVRDIKEPPNDPKTIARKGSSNPLIDTGLLRRSMNHELLTK